MNSFLFSIRWHLICYLNRRCTCPYCVRVRLCVLELGNEAATAALHEFLAASPLSFTPHHINQRTVWISLSLFSCKQLMDLVFLWYTEYEFKVKITVASRSRLGRGNNSYPVPRGYTGHNYHWPSWSILDMIHFWSNREEIIMVLMCNIMVNMLPLILAENLRTLAGAQMVIFLLRLWPQSRDMAVVTVVKAN